jgi:hypothetical protein
MESFIILNHLIKINAVFLYSHLVYILYGILKSYVFKLVKISNLICYNTEISSKVFACWNKHFNFKICVEEHGINLSIVLKWLLHKLIKHSNKKMFMAPNKAHFYWKLLIVTRKVIRSLLKFCIIIIQFHNKKINNTLLIHEANTWYQSRWWYQ